MQGLLEKSSCSRAQITNIGIEVATSSSKQIDGYGGYEGHKAVQMLNGK